ncbi:MAG: DUF805 domain-containing protein [Acidobacteria bacterium]|nr:DUF805 domain-containing protein [Acidobacteriota bacterium]
MPDDPTDPDLPLYGASPTIAYARFWRRYLVFSGRASLSEYWWAALLNVLAAVVLGAVGGILLAVGGSLAAQGSAIAAVPNALGAVLVFVLALYVLGLIVPGIAISVRRLHDANLSGLLYLLVFVPSVGWLIVTVLTVLPSNPDGRRFDLGSPRWAPSASQPASPPTGRPAAAPPEVNGGFDAWPAPTAVAPATAPMPIMTPAGSAPSPEAAQLAAWRSVGEVERVEPKLGLQPSWRRQGYLVVRRSDGIDILTTAGLGETEGAAALGPGAEVFLAGRGLGATPDAVGDGWRFTIVAAVARRIGASGMHLPAELEQYGALSLTVPADAPDGWRGPDGGVGVLIGVGLPGVPDSVASTAGEVRLVGLIPLRPDELQRILDGGRAVRASIASRLASLPPAALTDPDRPSV